jgi:hypothetical protein
MPTTSDQDPWNGFPQLDRSRLSLGPLEDDADRTYWLSRTPLERLEGIELLRRLNYGETATGARLQRFLEIARERFE